MASSNLWVTFTKHVGLLQDVIEVIRAANALLLITEAQTVFFFFDCHYYFHPRQIPVPGYDTSKVFVTGINFHPYQGTYDLPLGEGSYTVRDNNIEMLTRESGIVYEHKAVHWREPQNHYPSGFATWFYDTCQLSDFTNKLTLPTRLDPGVNV